MEYDFSEDSNRASFSLDDSVDDANYLPSSNSEASEDFEEDEV